MSKTRTAHQLFVVAMQDLLDAERAWGDRGPALGDDASTDVATFLRMDVEQSKRQADRLVHLLTALAEPLDGDRNIWLRAILDDADRDIRSTVAGPLRDIALIGAFRKGKQAERVSYETAIALAAQLHRTEDAALLTRSRDEEAESDARLQQMLGAVAAESIAEES